CSARTRVGPLRRDRHAARGRRPARIVVRILRHPSSELIRSDIMQPDILVTAPLPPFLYEPLMADYHCHDYYQSSHKPGLLAAEGTRIRGLVQGGGTMTPTSL